MKNLFIITLLLSFSSSFFSQSKAKSWCSDFYGFELQYSNFHPKMENLNAYLNTYYGNSIENIASVGLSYKDIGKVNINDFKYDWNLDFNYILPTNYNSILNTNFFNLRGYQWGSMVHGHDILYKMKRIDLIIGGGFNAGRYILTENNINEKVELKNKFFAPKIASEFRVILKTFSFGARAEYQWDTSSRNWKSNSTQILPYTRFSGLNVQIFVGYGGLFKGSRLRK